MLSTNFNSVTLLLIKKISLNNNHKIQILYIMSKNSVTFIVLITVKTTLTSFSEKKNTCFYSRPLKKVLTNDKREYIKHLYASFVFKFYQNT